MADDTSDLPRRRLTFDPTINAGHILTFLTGIGLGFGAWSSMDKRVTVLEEARMYQKARDEQQDAQINGQLSEIKLDMKEVRKSIDQMRIEQQRGRP